MDKELLRSVIIGTGLLIIIGLLVWSYIKNLNSEAELDDEFEYDDEEADDEPEEPKFNLYDTLKSKLSFNFNFNFNVSYSNNFSDNFGNSPCFNR